MRRNSASAALFAGAFVLAAAMAGPAIAAPTGFSVQITAHTMIEGSSSTFESSLEGCESGVVANGDNAMAHFTPWGGSFTGNKEFTCEGGDSGFTIALRARFGGGGSTGSWTVVSGFGDFEGAKGSGSLVGVPISDVQIDDVYTGTFR